MPDPNKQYEEKLKAAIASAEKRILKIYEQSIIEIAFSAGGVRLQDKPFSLSLYPLLDKKIRDTISKMHLGIYDEIVSSVMDSWQLSNQKNDVLVDKRLAGKTPSPKGRQILYDPNHGALMEFINRKERGLNLSKRVWNLLDPFKKEMEQALGISIAKGKSAAKMATEMKQYLNDPDKLFRRVRGKDGKLTLSRAAREYHPGQGVYRSSYKNALRLTATENNIAYRTADHERWKDLPFVTGIEVHTSNNHPEFDICDELKGKYPKDFLFTGWHPKCRCYQTSIMVSDEEYDKIEDAILRGEKPKVPDSLLIKTPPAGFSKWVRDNRERVEGWSNKPYWYKDNKQYLPQKSSIKASEIKTSKTPISKQIPTRTSAPKLKEQGKPYNLDVLMNEPNERFAWYMKNTTERVSQIREKFPNLLPEEVVSLDMYSNTSYRQINRYLMRKDETGPSAYEDNFEKLLNSALDKLPDYKRTVYRGGDFDQLTLDAYQEAFKKGEVVEKAFISTSKETGLAFEGNTFMIIESKTGKSIEEIVEFGQDSGQREAEVLFKSGRKFKVTEMRKETYVDKWTNKKKKRTLIRLTEL